ncbi:cell envelope integrity protein TolA [Clostridium botulinum D/C]|nr:hypothetical protein Z952_08635 [Clostridium botulinum C/D str. BKT75002]KEI07595.1 hypothetical protein Z954_03835 [Clostridium botulinum C/D str. BKT2873]MCD3350087.1 cell envelope integrity protein TolA [Clostridium botulinum D/C]QPW60008.1 cell envelope integrity protein TolA [Clostridium botulinum]MCD3359227.1 cell envelope integrity protein TolA [Clostridium botulinum D/C]
MKMIKKKRIKEFCVAATLSGALMAGLHTTVYAVITDYAIKVNEQIFAYNQNELEQSFLNYKSGEKSRLYEDFRSKLSEGNGFYAFKDDKKGFVPYEAVEKGFLKSKDNNNKSFNINKFVEEHTCKPVEVQIVRKVSIDEKNEIIIKENNTTNNKEVNKEIKKEEKPQNTSSSSSRGGSSGSSSSSKEVKPSINKVPEIKKEEKQPLPAVIPEGNREEVKKVVQPEPQISQGKVSIKSQITQTAQRPRLANYQVTTIIIEGTVENDGIFEIAGERLEVKKGDSYSKVADKIYNKFKNNENWEVIFKYVQSGYKANLTFTSKKLREHIDSLVVNGNGIKFKAAHEQYGKLAISERREICTVTVLNNSESNNTLKIKVSSDILRNTFATLSVEIKAGDSKEKIAEKISNELKKNANITQYFTVKNSGSQIMLTQKLADSINLTVTAEGTENKLVKPVKEVVEKQQSEEEKRAQAQKEQQDRQAQLQREAEAKRQQAEKEAQIQKEREAAEKKAKEQQQAEEEKRAQAQRKEQERQIQLQKEAEAKKQQEEAQRLAEVKSNMLIKSEITREPKRGVSGSYQSTTILIQGTVIKKGQIQIAGETVEVEQGDNYSKVADKIYRKFQNNENWEVNFKYIQVGVKSNLNFTSKKIKEHVDSLVQNGNGLNFASTNERFGSVGVAEVKGESTITVLNTSTENKNVKLKIENKVKTLPPFEIQIQLNKQDSKEKIAEKIAQALQNDQRVSRYYQIKNNGLKVTLTQKNLDMNNSVKVSLV